MWITRRVNQRLGEDQVHAPNVQFELDKALTGFLSTLTVKSFSTHLLTTGTPLAAQYNLYRLGGLLHVSVVSFQSSWSSTA